MESPTDIVNSKGHQKENALTITSTRFIRLTLVIAALFTAVGAYIFAFPDSALGRQYELPGQVPALYRALLGYILLMFAAMYAWLATQAAIYRPLLYLGVFGQGGAFAVAIALLMTGTMGSSIVQMLAGDAVFATIWLVWLLRSSTPGATVE